MLSSDCCCEYWPDILTWILIAVTKSCDWSETFSKRTLFVTRIIFGFVCDVAALIMAAVQYGFDFKNSNTGEPDQRPLIFFILFIVLWAAFIVVLLLVLCILPSKKESNEEIKRSNIYQTFLGISKVIGIICSSVLLSLALNGGPNYSGTTVTTTKASFTQSTTTEPTLFEKVGVLDGFIITYSLIDLFLNCIETLFLIPFRCCSNCQKPSRVENDFQRY